MARRKPIPRSQRKEFNRGTKLSRNSVGAKDDVKNLSVGLMVWTLLLCIISTK